MLTEMSTVFFYFHKMYLFRRVYLSTLIKEKGENKYHKTSFQVNEQNKKIRRNKSLSS